MIDHHARIQDVFREIDTDGSGTLEKDELDEFLRKLGVAISTREMNLVWDEVRRKIQRFLAPASSPSS